MGRNCLYFCTLNFFISSVYPQDLSAEFSPIQNPTKGILWLPSPTTVSAFLDTLPTSGTGFPFFRTLISLNTQGSLHLRCVPWGMRNKKSLDLPGTTVFSGQGGAKGGSQVGIP